MDTQVGSGNSRAAALRREAGIFLILLCSTSLLIWKCWNAEFLAYDDVAHIGTPQVFGQGSLLDLFKSHAESQYIPITLISYRFDFAVFGEWMLHSPLNSWAFAVRLMSCVYHAAAAYLLMRFLLELGVSRGAAFFIAIVFALHPMACESVCWASERKNVLAGMFGFAAIWAAAALEGRRWRLPAVTLLYALAVLSKPSALGILPVLVLLDLSGGRGGLRGAYTLGGPAWKAGRTWLAAGLRAAPLAAISAFVIAMTMQGGWHVRMSPPGGSLFTAALTDVEILARYLHAAILPTNISFAYYVAPIVSILDARLWAYGAVLLVAAGLTLWLADNRRRAAFGWLWALAALGPSLNFVSTAHLMQDRFFYLSLPGVLLAAVEAVKGLFRKCEFTSPLLLRAAAAGFVTMLASLSFVRGGDFTDTYALFSDAVKKQPLSGIAHCGLLGAYVQALESEKKRAPGSDTIQYLEQRVSAERRVFLEQCPDARRHYNFAETALKEARASLEHDDLGRAERLLTEIAYEAKDPRPSALMRAAALQDLAMVRVQQQQPAAALALIDEALALGEGLGRSRLIRARLELAQSAAAHNAGDAGAARESYERARQDLAAVPDDSDVYPLAQALLQQQPPFH